MFVDPKLTDAMFLVPAITFAGAFMVVFAGWKMRKASSFLRYACVAAGQAILVGGMTWLLALGSVDDIVAGAKKWASVSLFGWIIILGMLLMIVSPFISVPALISIRRNPASMTDRYFGRTTRVGFTTLRTTRLRETRERMVTRRMKLR